MFHIFGFLFLEFYNKYKRCLSFQRKQYQIQTNLTCMILQEYAENAALGILFQTNECTLYFILIYSCNIITKVSCSIRILYLFIYILCETNNLIFKSINYTTPNIQLRGIVCFIAAIHTFACGPGSKTIGGSY